MYYASSLLISYVQVSFEGQNISVVDRENAGNTDSAGPRDSARAQGERNKKSLEHLPQLFVSQSKAKVIAYMDSNHSLAKACPKCGTGQIKCKEGLEGLIWYCTNWNATPKCTVAFRDE